jgi:hypothetical protein
MSALSKANRFDRILGSYFIGTTLKPVFPTGFQDCGAPSISLIS